MDANGCNKIYCDITKQEVVILHSETCIKGDKFAVGFLSNYRDKIVR